MVKRSGKPRKGLSLLLHAQRRALLRYDLQITWDELVSLGRLIQKHHEGRVDESERAAVFVKKQSERVSHWYVWYKGQWLPTVYDCQRRLVVTVLPVGCGEEWHHHLVLPADPLTKDMVVPCPFLFYNSWYSGRQQTHDSWWGDEKITL